MVRVGNKIFGLSAGRAFLSSSWAAHLVQALRLAVVMLLLIVRAGSRLGIFSQSCRRVSGAPRLC